MTWKSLYGKGLKNRPAINEIIAFLPEDVGALYQRFSTHLQRVFGVGCKPPTYTEAAGWVYTFGLYNINLFNRVTIEDDAFTVQGLRVHDENSYDEAVKLAASSYDDYKKRFDLRVAAIKEKQKQRTKIRLEREKTEMDAILKTADKERLNKYRWSPKISRQLLKRLYVSDVKGFKDEELANEVGFTLYARCLQGREEGKIKDSGKLKCHNCREVIQAVGKGLLLECACGYQYLYRDYRRSFRTNNMPFGAAQEIFSAFVDSWERAKGYAEKMRLIDNLIHEFHINLNSGVKGRFVGVNLIEGTKKQIADLILELAYGDVNKKQAFADNANANMKTNT
ncbi:MAG: hypothetical protein FWB80_01960 [Defluviitaleaceae bacterium]|nr:hypothetical protein [Defluviitaleaceae bacterium]